MGSNNPSIGAMLLEICITELEDTSNSTQSLTSAPRPVVQESSHPYVDDVTLKGKLNLIDLTFNVICYFWIFQVT